MEQSADNAYDQAYDARDPVIHVGVAVEPWLLSSIASPKIPPAMKRGSNPKRPVLATGKASAAKATKNTSL